MSRCRGLTKSTQKEDILQGVQMFGVLYQQNPDRRRECLYYLALGHYRLGNFDEAARFNSACWRVQAHQLLHTHTLSLSLFLRPCLNKLLLSFAINTDMLLSKEPANLQAQSLNQLIEKDVSKGQSQSPLALSFACVIR